MMKKLRFTLLPALVFLLLGSGLSLAEVGAKGDGPFSKFVFGANGGGTPLAKAGYDAGPLLVAERLPNGEYLSEYEASPTKGRARLRIPVRTNGDSLTWSANAAYTQALLNLTTSSRLPPGEGQGEWADVQRLPALSLIVTKKRIITPLGEASMTNLEESEIDIKVVKELGPLMHRWIDEVGQKDPALANIDLILDGELTWLELNHVIFTFAGMGFYDVQIVVQDADGRLNAIRVAPPVRAFKDEAPPIIVAMYPQEGDNQGFRIANKGNLLTSEASCAEGMSFCAKNPDGYAAALKIAPKTSVSMFGATKDVKVKDAMPYMERTIAHAGPQHRITLIGYVQE